MTSPKRVSPYRRPRAKPDGESGLQKVAGWPSVEALFRVNPRLVERLVYEPAMDRLVAPLKPVLAKARKVYRQVGAEELARMAGTDMHGGVVAFVPHRPVRPVTPEDFRALGAKRVPLLLLDGVGNPQNIGAIARTAAFFGLKHLLMSDHRAQAGLSDAAFRIAKGGLEYVEPRRVADVAEALAGLREVYHVIGSSLDGRHSLADVAMRRTGDSRPTLLVLGNEEHGLPPATLARRW